MRHEGALGNLIEGITEQPQRLQSKDKLRYQMNMYPDLIQGIKTRPGTYKYLSGTGAGLHPSGETYLGGKFYRYQNLLLVIQHLRKADTSLYFLLKVFRDTGSSLVELTLTAQATTTFNSIVQEAGTLADIQLRVIKHQLWIFSTAKTVNSRSISNNRTKGFIVVCADTSTQHASILGRIELTHGGTDYYVEVKQDDIISSEQTKLITISQKTTQNNPTSGFSNTEQLIGVNTGNTEFTKGTFPTTLGDSTNNLLDCKIRPLLPQLAPSFIDSQFAYLSQMKLNQNSFELLFRDHPGTVSTSTIKNNDITISDSAAVRGRDNNFGGAPFVQIKGSDWNITNISAPWTDVTSLRIREVYLSITAPRVTNDLTHIWVEFATGNTILTGGTTVFNTDVYIDIEINGSKLVSRKLLPKTINGSFPSGSRAAMEVSIPTILFPNTVESGRVSFYTLDSITSGAAEKSSLAPDVESDGSISLKSEGRTFDFDLKDTDDTPDYLWNFNSSNLNQLTEWHRFCNSFRNQETSDIDIQLAIRNIDITKYRDEDTQLNTVITSTTESETTQEQTGPRRANSPDDVLEELFGVLVDVPLKKVSDDTAVTDTIKSLGGAGFIKNIKNGYMFVPEEPGGAIKVTSVQFRGLGRGIHYVVKELLQSTIELPNEAPDNFFIHLVPDPNSDYWMKFVGEDSATGRTQEGYWEEAIVPGQSTGIVNSTMPHWFTFTNTATSINQNNFLTRTVGDTDNNPEPEFIGSKIKDIGVYQNRLFIMTQDNITFSRAFDFNDFYLSTTLTTDISNPVLIDSPEGYDKPFDHSFIFNGELFILSIQGEQLFKVTEGTLTPDSGEILQDTILNLDPNFRIFNHDIPRKENSIILPVLTQYANKFNQVDIIDSLSAKTISNISIEVPNFVKGSVKSHCFNKSNSLLCYVTDSSNDQNVIYLNKFLQQGQELIYSAWFPFRLAMDVKIEFLTTKANDLFIYYYESRVLKMLRLPIQVVTSVSRDFNQDNLALDDKTFINSSFLATTLFQHTSGTRKTILLDYDLRVNKDPRLLFRFQEMPMVRAGDQYRYNLSNKADINRAYENFKFVHGEPFDYSFECNTPLPVDQEGNKISAQPLVVQTYYLHYRDTGPFKVEAVRERDTLTRKELDIQPTDIFTDVERSGTLQVPWSIRESDAVLKVSGDSHIGLHITDIEFVGDLQNQKRRLPTN